MIRVPATKYVNTILLVLFGCFSNLGAQSSESRYDFTRGAGIPLSLRASLVSRMDAFIKSQREKQWESVWELMGKNRPAAPGRQITSAEKKCRLDQIQSAPLIQFRPSQALFSTEILSLPLSKRWWFIKGEGHFETESGIVVKKTNIIAKRIAGNWYFQGPSYDDEWEEKYVSPNTPSLELVKFVEIVKQPTSPVQIENLSVTIDPEYLSLRKIKFDVRNNSSKTIRGIGYKVLEGVRVSVGSGQEIKPRETGSFEVTVSAYSYFCQGEQKRKLIIDSVWFKDNSEWKMKTSAHKKR